MSCKSLDDCGDQYTTTGCLIKHNNSIYKVWEKAGELTYAETLKPLGQDNTIPNSTEWKLDSGMYRLEINGHNPKCIGTDGQELSQIKNESTCEDAGHAWVGTSIPADTVVGLPVCTEHPMVCASGTCERADSVNHKATLDIGCLVQSAGVALLLNSANKTTVTIQQEDAPWYHKCLQNASALKDPSVLDTQFCQKPEDCRTLSGECLNAAGNEAVEATVGTCTTNNKSWVDAKCMDDEGNTYDQVRVESDCDHSWVHGQCTVTQTTQPTADSTRTACLSGNNTWKPSSWAQFYCSNAAPCDDTIPGGVHMTPAQQIQLFASKNKPEAIEPLCRLNSSLCSRFTEGTVSTPMCAQDPLGCAKTIVDPIGRCDYLPSTKGCPFIPPPPNIKDVVRLHYEEDTLKYENKRSRVMYSVSGTVTILVIGVLGLIIYDRFFTAK